jgi:hypothetical protein
MESIPNDPMARFEELMDERYPKESAEKFIVVV